LAILTATFGISLPGRFLLSRSEADQLFYRVQYQEFDVELQIVPDFSSKVKEHNEPFFSFAANAVRVRVRRNELTDPPAVETDDAGMTSYVGQTNYFEERSGVYRQAAVEIVNRAIMFFRYTLQNPHLQFLTGAEQDLQNPTWTDENGRDLRCGVHIMFPGIPGLMGRPFGVERFSGNRDISLTEALKNSLPITTRQELLSDAQSAALPAHALLREDRSCSR
jgi:hypothetical protein